MSWQTLIIKAQRSPTCVDKVGNSDPHKGGHPIFCPYLPLFTEVQAGDRGASMIWHQDETSKHPLSEVPKFFKFLRGRLNVWTWSVN